MHPTLEILGLVITVAVVAGASRRFGWPTPLLLVVAGVVASYLPGIERGNVDPDVRQAIVLLSVGLVGFTTVAVGLVTWWVVPTVSIAAAFALGAVVAPTDAVAASAIARRVGMPRRIVSLLEGESLVNDATALVALNTAIAAITGNVIAGRVVLDFGVAAVGGAAVGLAAATVLAMIRKHIQDPVLDTTLSFVAPYVAFLPAQAIHASGALSVVIAGLLLGHKSPVLQTAASRIAEHTNWRTVQFLLENGVFMLIGLQLRGILDDVDQTGQAVWTCLAVVAATILARFVWIFSIMTVYRHGTQRMREEAWSWRLRVVPVVHPAGIDPAGEPLT